jgi:uncharacterized protein with GYD domain
MAQYLLQVSYSQQAWASLVRSPQDRTEVVGKVVENLGGKLDRIWFAFGEHDVVAILEMPDNVSAAALAIAFSAGGACTQVKTTPLLGVQEGLQAMKKAGQTGYRPPQ